MIQCDEKGTRVGGMAARQHLPSKVRWANIGRPSQRCSYRGTRAVGGRDRLETTEIARRMSKTALSGILFGAPDGNLSNPYFEASCEACAPGCKPSCKHRSRGRIGQART
jgi:hypothetical protein